MLHTLLGKYRNIVISIALFLLLDASVLLLNFYISFEIADDASGVNLSGRQRMLSQRMVKSLFDIEYSMENPIELERALKELNLTVNLFDTTLSAFDQGATVTGADGEPVKIQQVTSEKARVAVDNAKVIWKPYKVLLEDVQSDVDLFELGERMSAAISYASMNNLTLLKLMNDLTIELEKVASSKATRLRIIQTVGITLALVNFFIIMFHFLRQLKESDQKVESARKETIEILETVNEGLFLLDNNYVISSQYSSVLEEMFARKKIGGMTLEELLGEIVTNKDLETSKRFIALLFREDIKSNLISDLNPLRKIEVNIADSQGRFINKFFSFTFERVYEDNAIKDVLVTVNDITERVILERELALTKEQSERQIEVLTSILHANPELLQIYVKDVFNSLSEVNAILREPSKSDVALRRKLNDIHVFIHRIKGEAASLSLDSFEEIAHEFEQNIHEIRDKKEIGGDDFLPLVVRLEKLVKHAESVRTLTEKLASFASAAPSSSIRSINDGSWNHLDDLVQTVSERQEKKVSLVKSGLSEIDLSEELRSLINDIAIQGIRNSVVHGIESPDERLELNKGDAGRIDIRLARSSSSVLEFSIKDDGYGIDSDRIRAAAIKSGNWTEEQLDGFDQKRLVSLIFEPGFSTAKEHTRDAGGGVGMDVIKKRVNALRGKIRVQSRRGIGTKISVSIPFVESAEKAA